MPETRKDAPLPPLPWRLTKDFQGNCSHICNAEGAVVASDLDHCVANLLVRAPAVEQAARDALDYLEEVGPCHLDAGMVESGCDQITERPRAALENDNG